MPLLIYLTVSLTGYASCGSFTPDIILNRDAPTGSKDILLSIGKIGLLVSLLVGITLRTQSNRSGLFEIMDKLASIFDKEHALLVKGARADQIELERRMQDSASQNASISDLDQGVDRGFWLPIFVNWLNCGIPSIVAIIFADDFVKYIEAAAGFLAPMFLIFFPCVITIKLHKDKKMKVHPFIYGIIWAYLIIGMIWSYSSLVLTLVY